MKPSTTDDVLTLLDASCASAALGAALETGLFWLLERQPLTASDISVRLGVPLPRCQYWLQVLAGTGLLEQRDATFAVSDAARASILGAYGRDTWAFLALESRERFPALVDFATRIKGAAGAAAAVPRPHYVDLMGADANRARRFTRMLYELHLPLAAQLTAQIDAEWVDRLLDVGGGSGVVSIAVARRYPGVSAVVVDVPNVCEAGRELAAENGLDARVTYHPADFTSDTLPSPFDLAVMCDVGVHSQDVFKRVAAALAPAGKFILVDVFAPAPGVAPASRAHWALERSMFDPSFHTPTVGEVEGMLREAGFEVRSRRTIDYDADMTLIEAVRC